MKLQKIPLPFFQEMITPGALDEVLCLPESVSLAINLNFDRIGAMQTRNGITSLGAKPGASSTILGMAPYVNNAGTTYRLVVKVGTAVYSLSGTTWSSVRTGLDAASKARFTSLVDYIFMVDGNAGGVCSTFNGSGNFGTTNATNLQKGDFIENFRSRIWIGDSATDKLYYSDVVTTSNTITGGTSFLQISPQDGDVMTGLKRSPKALLVFKRNHIYRVTSINSTDPDPFINVGTHSQESIIECKDGIAFHSPKTFYILSSDSINPTDIGKKISDVVKAIPRTYWSSISGWEDGDNLYWSIGDITLYGISLTNVVCRYTLSTQRWTLYSYPTEIKGGCKYDDGTTAITAIGDDVGNVFTFDSGTSDNGTSIFYSVETQWYYVSDVKSETKKIKELAVLFENANGATISYKIDNDSDNTWRPIGQLSEDLYQTLSLNSEFIRIKLRIAGNLIGSPLILRGFELISSAVTEK